MSKYLGGLAIFAVPFFVYPYFPEEMQIDAPKWMALYLFGNLLFSLFLLNYLNPLFSLFHAIISFSALFTGFGSYQIYPLVQWTGGLLFTLWFMQEKRETHLFVFKMIVFSCLLMSALAFLQTQDLDPIFRYGEGIDRTHPTGMMGQHTKFGPFVAAGASIALSFGWVWAFIPLTIMCLWTGSSFSIAALIAGFMVVLKYQSKTLFKYTMAGGLLLLAMLYFIPEAASLFYGQGRKEVWDATIRAWLIDRPLMGFGPGSYYFVFADNYEPMAAKQHGAFGHAHNEYIQALFEYGALGVIGLVCTLLCLFHGYLIGWWRAVKQDKEIVAAQAALAAILVNAIGNFPLQLAPTFIIAMLSMALVLREQDYIIKQRSQGWQPQIFSSYHRLRNKLRSIMERLTT